MIDGKSSIVTYMMHLDDGNFEAAAAVFADDATYIRPSLDEERHRSGGLDVVVGRDSILEYFKRRGPRPYRHYVRVVMSDGGRESIEGTVEGDPDMHTAMLATAELSEDGRISRYFGLAWPMDPDVMKLCT